MAKTFAGDRKWTTGRSRVVRPTDQKPPSAGTKESAKITLDALPGSARKKRSWEK